MLNLQKQLEIVEGNLNAARIQFAAGRGSESTLQRLENLANFIASRIEDEGKN